MRTSIRTERIPESQTSQPGDKGLRIARYIAEGDRSVLTLYATSLYGKSKRKRKTETHFSVIKMQNVPQRPAKETWILSSLTNEFHQQK